MPPPAPPTGPSFTEVAVAVAAILSVVVALAALLVSTRAYRVAGVEAFPVMIDNLYLGVELRNFGPRHANCVDWSIVLLGVRGESIEEQSLKVPVMAVGETRRVLMGWLPSPGQKRTLAALANTGGTLVSRCAWEDARGFVIAKRLHRNTVELPLADVLSNISGALQRQPDDGLAEVRELRTAILALRDSVDAYQSRSPETAGHESTSDGRPTPPGPA